MIRLHSAGGLGNQLFLWAQAHRWAEETGERVLIFTDRFHHSRYTESPLQLLNKNCEHSIEIVRSDILGFILALDDKLSGVNSTPTSSLLRRTVISRHFDPFSLTEASRLKGKIISGFFQNASEIVNQAKTVATEFERALSPKWQSLVDRFPILNSPFQTMHVRRGDYVDSGFGALSLEYYSAQVREGLPLIILTEHQSEIRDFVARWPGAIVLDSSQLNEWETLLVVARASLIIAANSTLSWWGSVFGSINGCELSTIPEPWYENIPCPPNNFQILGLQSRAAMFS